MRYDYEKFRSHYHAHFLPSLPTPAEIFLSLFLSWVMNKFNAVVWDVVQGKNNETLAFDFYLRRLFLERDPLRNTGSNCPLRRVCEGSVPTTAVHREAKHQEPTKRLPSSAKPKCRPWKTPFLPLEKTDTKTRTKPPCVCFGSGLVTGP